MGEIVLVIMVHSIVNPLKFSLESFATTTSLGVDIPIESTSRYLRFLQAYFQLWIEFQHQIYHLLAAIPAAIDQ